MNVRKLKKLLELEIDEISLVDKPANPFALAVLHKRDDGPDPDHMQALLESIRSAYEADATRQEKTDFLRETLSQYSEITGRDGLADIAALTKKTSRSDPFPNEPERRGKGYEDIDPLFSPRAVLDRRTLGCGSCTIIIAVRWVRAPPPPAPHGAISRMPRKTKSATKRLRPNAHARPLRSSAAPLLQRRKMS